MKLTILIDNKQAVKQLKCEHGLSFLLQTAQCTILFDTGQSDKLLFNAHLLDLNLEEVDYVVLSHGHYDHTGGLPHFLEINSKATVFVHPHAFKQRFSQSPQMVKENGVAWRNQLDQYAHRLLFIEEDIEPAKGIWLLSNIKAQQGFEPENDKLVTKIPGAYVPDTFDDELILVAKENEDPIVICGCAHTGIVNILHQVRQRLNFSDLSLVAGGMHLKGKEEEEISKVISGLSPFKIKQWALSHCTGQPAFKQFETAFPEKVVYGGGGMTFTIE